MELTITKTEEKPLLKRREIEGRVFFQNQTPSRLDILGAVAKEVKADESLVVIDSIHTAYGETAATFSARVYSDADTLKRLERANLMEKHARPEPEPEPEAPAQEAAESEEAAE